MKNYAVFMPNGTPIGVGFSNCLAYKTVTGPKERKCLFRPNLQAVVE